MLGEVVAWRNLFWSLSNAMANNPVPWNGDAVLPNAQPARATGCSPATPIRASRRSSRRPSPPALIYLPSSAKDFANPEIDAYLATIRPGHPRHRLQGAHQDHEAAVGRGRHRIRRPARTLRDATTPAIRRTSASRRCGTRKGPAPSTAWRRSPISAWPTTTRTAGPARPGSIRTMSHACPAAGRGRRSRISASASLIRKRGEGAEAAALPLPAAIRASRPPPRWSRFAP